MAFRQTERQPLRIVPVHDDIGEEGRPLSPLASALPPLIESQTRIIFSPATDATTTASSYIAPTSKGISTAGRSRLSDLGSLQSVIVRSLNGDGESPLSGSYSEVIEDDAELDSLDSHLPEFRAGPANLDIIPHSHSNPVLPTHDGLGSFHLDHAGTSTNVQDHIYAFEQFNPRRVRRRRESIELAQRELQVEEARETDKMRRIEAWRLEQSRYLLQEIERETRRRGIADSAVKLQDSGSQSQVASPSVDGYNAEWHDHDNPAGPRKKEVTWTQTIKSVIKEIISIDDKILSILFGEALPDEEDDLSSTPKASEFNVTAGSGQENAIARQDQDWQDRILARIARELGLLVHRLSDHPGAFSTYVRMQQMPLPYAGLPVIPETAVPDQPKEAETTSISSIEFQPTIRQAQPIDIPLARQASAASDVAQPSHDGSGMSFTQQEWEQELDVKLVFRYLRSRFTSRPTPSSPPIVSTAASTAHLKLSSPQDTAAKAARVRLHHPLVSRSRPIEKRTFRVTTPSSPAAMRHASSCASQSTRRSARRGSGSSSRHYWDIGGSVGTGSVIAPTGPMGSWGDV